MDNSTISNKIILKLILYIFLFSGCFLPRIRFIAFNKFFEKLHHEHQNEMRAFHIWPEITGDLVKKKPAVWNNELYCI